MSQFYLADGDNRKGPFPAEQLPAQGLTAQTLVWREGMADWLPAETVPELVPFLPRAHQPQYNPQFNQPVYPHQPQNIQYQSPLGPPPGNGMAVASMVLGILGLILFWTVLLGIPLGILAIIFGSISMKKHKGFAITGIVCGSLAILGVILIFIIAAANS